jgi:hypothetical protein
LTSVPIVFLFAWVPYTRGYMLASALRFALGKLRIREFKRLLTDEDRTRIADDVVDQLKGATDPWRLAEELPVPFSGVTGPSRPGE